MLWKKTIVQKKPLFILESFDISFIGTRCGEHGQCVGSLRVPTCECNPGWTGKVFKIIHIFF